jgi:hypothetical protein
MTKTPPTLDPIACLRAIAALDPGRADLDLTDATGPARAFLEAWDAQHHACDHLRDQVAYQRRVIEALAIAITTTSKDHTGHAIH